MPTALSILDHPRATLGTLLLPNKMSPSLGLYRDRLLSSPHLLLPWWTGLGQSHFRPAFGLLGPSQSLHPQDPVPPVTPSHRAVCTSSWFSLSGEAWLIQSSREVEPGHWGGRRDKRDAGPFKELTHQAEQDVATIQGHKGGGWKEMPPKSRPGYTLGTKNLGGTRHPLHPRQLPPCPHSFQVH